MQLDKAIYSLEEAERISVRAVQEVFRLANKGEVALYVRQPNGSKVFSVDFADLYPPSTPAYRTVYEIHPPSLPIQVERISFLKLDLDSCIGLQINGFAEQTVFSSGMSISNDGTIAIIQPSRPAEPALGSLFNDHNSFVWYFACYQSNIKIERTERTALHNPIAVTSERNSTFVTRQVLAMALGSQSTVLFDSDRDMPLDPAPHISDGLLSTRRFLIDYWSRLGPNGFPMPAAREVAARLLSDYGFVSEKQAQGAAALLRLCSVSPDHSTGELRLSAPGLKVLIECAHVHWMHSLNGSAFEYRTHEIVSWIQEHTGLNKHAAEGCAALIRPNSVSKAGRKRKL